MNNFAKMPKFKYVLQQSFILSLIVFTVFVVSLKAQQKTVLQEIQSMNLPVAKGKITVYYAPGYERRVAEVRPLVEEMMAFYEKKLQLKQDFSVAILTKEQWQQHISMLPYGFPFVREKIAFLPATTEGVVTVGVIAMKASASPATLKKIKQSGYEFDEAAIKMTDLIGLHELGHVYTVSYGIKPPTKWSSEFLASYFAYAFLKEKHPKLAKILQAMNTDLFTDAVKPKYTSLEDFERLYSDLGADNYGWYQGKFLKKGSQIYDSKKLTFLVDVKKVFPLDEKENIAPGEALARLEKISPGITEWSKSLK